MLHILYTVLYMLGHVMFLLFQVQLTPCIQLAEAIGRNTHTLESCGYNNLRLLGGTILESSACSPSFAHVQEHADALPHPSCI